ncbi:zinc finger protein 696 isoform X4 [Ooceraea biroi]|nr:zinc finger protein 696 isoform X4 [Ooceraea biroi]
MESRNSSMLESSREENVLSYETVKSTVTRDDRSELETEEGFLLVSQAQQERYAEEENVDEATLKERTAALAFINLCRICANANDHLIPIFEGDGVERNLAQKILKHLPIRISEDDSLPLQLCYHCATTLLAWHELSEGCLNAERKLLGMQGKQEYDTPAMSLDNLEVPAPITTMETTVNIANSEASEPDQQADDKTEARGTEETDESNRSCGVRTPSRVFQDAQRAFWKPYRKRCRPRTRPRGPSATAEDSDSVWIAVMDVALDEQPVAEASGLRNNDQTRPPVRTSEEERVARDHETSNDRAVAKSHDRITDDDPIDPMDVASEDKYLQETIGDDKVSSWQKPESFQCAECGKCFKLKDSYLRHMRIHKNERPFTCHVCGKQFRDSGGLTRHLKDVHAKLKNFTCDLCGRSFASKATREDHRRTHTGERPYVCDSCGKTFKSKASLYIHGKLHTDEFPHACSYCGKRFRRRQEVLAHVTTHTGEKNHECDVCAKKFRVKSELARHKLIHSEEKPFVCLKCGLAFRQKRYLNNHDKSRHGESLRAS